ncbi:hypothetical protein Cgig2_021764 [Carnegiea gigantea]|uniref:Uncharacterized protein n=1 Tax=Carnegiea gigantea TaxID=171969 RepID=A0A9Q1GKZ6_9CARY|nr:hypothetical protein Cgig2_021764 [Carnegiea gigantea]
MSSWGFRGLLALQGPVNFGYKEELLQKPYLHHTFAYPLRQRSSLANMGFLYSLTTDEMELYALGNFEWYRREAVFPPRPLLYDYEELCPDFDLAMDEEYAQDYKVPKLPQVVFLTILLNDAVKVGVLRRIMETRRQEASSGSKEEESSGSDGQTPLPSDDNEEMGCLRSGDIDGEHCVIYSHIARTECALTLGSLGTCGLPLTLSIPLYKSEADIPMEGHLKAF